MKVKYLLASLLSLLVMSCTIIEQPQPDAEDQNPEGTPPALTTGAVSGSEVID